MIATVAILGRPNVGKSTLFNRLVGKRLAIVEPEPGVTRDWKEGEAHLAGVRFRLLDTPGLEDAKPGTLEASMRVQAEHALAQADVAILLFDAREGVTPVDRHFANWLRTRETPVIVVANKCEGRGGADLALDGFSLGLGTPVPVSAEHGEGLVDLYEALASYIEPGGLETPMAEISGQDLPLDEGEANELTRGPLRLAIVGRPNVGKSTLVNSLVGEERVLTGPEPGITRDAIPVDWTYDGRAIRLVDTAGLRRRSQVTARVERMSVEATERAIRLAEVVILVLDATVMLERQDLTIARRVVEEGRALVIAANKWDLIDDTEEALGHLRDRIERSLPQIKGVLTVTVSALTGKNDAQLMRTVFRAYAIWNRRVSTGELNRWLAALVERHPPPAVRGRPLRLRYMAQTKARPPTFILFASRPSEVPASYLRYIENGLRRDFGLEGTPLRITLRRGDNPFDPSSG
ncbi:MAG: ribosome biogenesis GTPase Der [Alphaproteobacteria bacterium]